jgi:hypothetical protein
LGTNPAGGVQGGCVINAAPLHVTMKEKIASQIRHQLTGAVAVGTFLAARGLIGTGDAAAVNDVAAQAIPIFASAVATIATRVGMTLAAKYLPEPFLRLLGWSKSNASALLLLCTAAAFLALPSCISTTDPNGTVSRKPDKETIGVVAGAAYGFARLFIPPPKAEPVATPPAVQAESGK